MYIVKIKTIKYDFKTYVRGWRITVERAGKR